MDGVVGGMKKMVNQDHNVVYSTGGPMPCKVTNPKIVQDRIEDVASKFAMKVESKGTGKDLSKSPRKMPGVVNESFKLDRSLQTQKKLMYNKGAIGVIPKEIRDKLIGKHFNSIDDFRKEAGILINEVCSNK